MELFGVVFAGLFGLIFGSFFNVLIWRIPRGESIVWPSSHCPQCKRPIKYLENIPLVSYGLLGGKCAGCKAPISIIYPLVEAITCAVAVLLWYTVPIARSTSWTHTVFLIVECAVLLFMIPITVIDLQHSIIPDSFTLTGIAIGLVVSFLPGDTTPLQSIFGILAGGGTLWFIGWLGTAIFRKGDAMGGGDIKMIAMIGALWGPKVAFLTIMFGSLLGSIIGVSLIAMQKLGQDHRIPFGPYLAIGLFVSILWGNQIIASYFQFVSGLLYR
jgi:leader peptidase (prepilin peptidase)/N-methyltransferase